MLWYLCSVVWVNVGMSSDCICVCLVLLVINIECLFMIKLRMWLFLFVCSDFGLVVKIFLMCLGWVQIMRLLVYGGICKENMLLYL